MQVIKSNRTQFEYDIQAILKSFYPEWEPRMLAPDSEVRDRRILEGEQVMELFFGEEEVTLKMLPVLHIYTWHPQEPAGTPEYKNAFKHVTATTEISTLSLHDALPIWLWLWLWLWWLWWLWIWLLPPTLL